MKYQFFNLPLNISTRQEYLDKIREVISKKEKKVFFYMNSYSFYLSFRNEEFRRAFLSADYVIADGYSIVWANKLIQKTEIEKVVFTHLFRNKLGNFLSEKKFSIFFLGGKENKIIKAINNIKSTFPEMNIAGFFNGYFNSTEEKKIIGEIAMLKPDLLVVGMGMPRAEIWIDNHQHELEANCIISVGAFFDYMAGEKSLAPSWLYNSGLEWVYRLIQEPVRLSKRYFIVQPFFLYKIFREYFKK